MAFLSAVRGMRSVPSDCLMTTDLIAWTMMLKASKALELKDAVGLPYWALYAACSSVNRAVVAPGDGFGDDRYT